MSPEGPKYGFFNIKTKNQTHMEVFFKIFENFYFSFKWAPTHIVNRTNNASFLLILKYYVQYTNTWRGEDKFWNKLKTINIYYWSKNNLKNIPKIQIKFNQEISIHSFVNTRASTRQAGIGNIVSSFRESIKVPLYLTHNAMLLVLNYAAFYLNLFI